MYRPYEQNPACSAEKILFALYQEALPVWSNGYGTDPEWSDSRNTKPIQKHAADLSFGSKTIKHMEETVPEPRLILVFSGKRKSGKDYVTDRIQER